ncbi:Ankyrin repeat domain-containing protein 44 [Cichlidogyrus casuarinus]|uniref:Ankyrin repeat domain-containing protein 44 n=1 Tax=Cichlidogyrus casuarinus TaxID=1844966 RepID=A0ABD2QQC0_9PLAT
MELQSEMIKKISREFQLLNKQQKRDAFKHTCATGSTRIVSALLNYVSPDDLETPFYAACLHSACQNGFLDVVELLVKNGSDIEMKQNGDTPLMVAVEMGHLSITSYLLSSGAHVNVKDNKQETALMKAIKKGHTTIVKELLLYGACPNLEKTNDLLKLADRLQQNELIFELTKSSLKLDSSLNLILQSYLHDSFFIQMNPSDDARRSLFPVQLINPNYETDYLVNFQLCSKELASLSNALMLFVICAVQLEGETGDLFHRPTCKLNFITILPPEENTKECFPPKYKSNGIRIIRYISNSNLDHMQEWRLKSSKPKVRQFTFVDHFSYQDKNSKHPLLLVGLIRIEVRHDLESTLKESNKVTKSRIAEQSKAKRVSHSNKENQNNYEETAIHLCIDHSNEGINSTFCTDTNCFLKEYCKQRANFRRIKRTLYKKLIEFGIDMIYEGEKNSRYEYHQIDKRRHGKIGKQVCEEHMLFGMDSIKCIESHCFLKQLPDLEFDLRLLHRQLNRKLIDAGIHI